jgi:hypothetical protein
MRVLLAPLFLICFSSLLLLMSVAVADEMIPEEERLDKYQRKIDFILRMYDPALSGLLTYGGGDCFWDTIIQLCIDGKLPNFQWKTGESVAMRKAILGSGRQGQEAEADDVVAAANFLKLNIRVLYIESSVLVHQENPSPSPRKMAWACPALPVGSKEAFPPGPKSLG